MTINTLQAENQIQWITAEFVSLLYSIDVICGHVVATYITVKSV